MQKVCRAAGMKEPGLSIEYYRQDRKRQLSKRKRKLEADIRKGSYCRTAARFILLL